MQHYDTIVVGSGTSAHYCATALKEGGQNVAIVDERKYGGTCALRGCQPKKYLVVNAEAVAAAAHLVGKGIVEAPRVSWRDLQAHKNEFLDGLSEDVVEGFQEQGIATCFGRAAVVSENAIEVDGKRLDFDNLVLATGAIPRPLDIPGSEHVHDSEHFLNMPELPKRILFIGGGYISFEFAHVSARAGSEATILHRSAMPLKAFDPDMVKVVMEASEAAGIKVVTEDEPAEIQKTDTGYLVKGTSGTSYEVDLIIEAIGRIPNLSALDGDHAKIEHSEKGVAVNDYLQSPSNGRVYAIGDCAATPYQLAPVADEEGKIAAHNILHGNSRSVDYSVVPSTVFTIPNLATVGLTEKEASDRALDFEVKEGSTTEWASSERIGEKHAAYKILIDRQSDTILGAHLVRHHASEVINIFALAMKEKITASRLAEFMWAYPTLTSDVKRMVK